MANLKHDTLSLSIVLCKFFQPLSINFDTLIRIFLIESGFRSTQTSWGYSIKCFSIKRMVLTFIKLRFRLQIFTILLQDIYQLRHLKNSFHENTTCCPLLTRVQKLFRCLNYVTCHSFSTIVIKKNISVQYNILDLSKIWILFNCTLISKLDDVT